MPDGQERDAPHVAQQGARKCSCHKCCTQLGLPDTPSPSTPEMRGLHEVWRLVAIAGVASYALQGRNPSDGAGWMAQQAGQAAGLACRIGGLRLLLLLCLRGAVGVGGLLGCAANKQAGPGAVEATAAASCRSSRSSCHWGAVWFSLTIHAVVYCSAALKQAAKLCCRRRPS